jgi:farnesyl-diphosphate farnesyltransferase
MLVKVSRSFAAVIMELPSELREAVMVFYLVLRALDSVEDDMAVDLKEKCALLLVFHEKTELPSYSLSGYGEKEHERDLLVNYTNVCTVYASLKPAYRAVIKDICARMGAGMAEFAQRDVQTVPDYELYCHYVAGLVGIGLSRLWGLSGLENADFATPQFEPLSNAMGLFLQKTNITRDYREDIDQVPPRIFYPRTIWAKYTKDFAAFREPANAAAGVRCVNHMIADAMTHATASIDYLSRLRQPDVFRFCAIPQAMAIATLERCYQNPQVLQEVIKIRKGEAVYLIEQCQTFAGTLDAFKHYSARLREKLNRNVNDPSAGDLETSLDALDKIVRQWQAKQK